jgi:hypothetical protein
MPKPRPQNTPIQATDAAIAEHAIVRAAAVVRSEQDAVQAAVDAILDGGTPAPPPTPPGASLRAEGADIRPGTAEALGILARDFRDTLTELGTRELAGDLPEAPMPIALPVPTIPTKAELHEVLSHASSD